MGQDYPGICLWMPVYVCHGAMCIKETAKSVSLMICNEARNSQWSLGLHLSQPVREGLSGPLTSYHNTAAW